MKRVAFLLAGLPIVFLCAVCEGQPCSKITGVVMDKQTGETLPGANIRNTMKSSSGTSTGTTGAFEIVASAGDTLRVTYIGYEDYSIILKDSVCHVKVYLETAVKNMQEVEVKAERIIAEEFTLRKIRKLEIYTNPSAKADPILAVNATPSATTTDESANISLRGGSPDETGVFLNNVPIHDAVRYSQLNGIGTFSIFNTALINNVQVYPGNPPLEHGGSTSGLIALQTDEVIPSKNTSMVSLTLASLGFHTSRKVNSRGSLSLFTNYQPSLLIRTLNSTALQDLKGFSSIDLGLHYFQKLKKGSVVKIFNYSIRESYKFYFRQPTYDGVFRQEKIRNFTVGNLRKRIGKTEISFNQGISFSNANYVYGTTNIDLKLHDLFSSFNIHHTGVSSEWKTGISYDLKSSDFNGSFPTFDFAAAENHPVSNARSKDYIRNPEWYGYYKKYIGAKWIAGGGVRKNLPIRNNRDYLSIQGNLHYTPHENWDINFSAGRYHKFQLPQGENSEPFIIRSTQYSIDIKQTSPQLENSFSAFYKTSTKNNVSSNVKGIELFTRYKLNDQLRFQVSLTSLEAMETKDNAGQPSPYNIHYFLRGNVEYKIQGTWTFTAVFLFRQGSYYYPVERAVFIDSLQVFRPEYSQSPYRLPSYNTIDISISKIFPFTEKITAIAFLSAGNITDFKNVRTYTYNFDYTQRVEYLFSRRTFYFGLIFSF